MKIAITGHCDGIGKAIYDKLADKGHELIGFDIADESGDIVNGREEIIEKSKDCDVFINNAFHMTGAQTDMFNDMYELWKDEHKQLINICSASKHYPSIFNSGLHFNYIAKKKVLWKNIVSKYRDTISKDYQLRIHTISPGLVDTAMTKDMEDETLKTSVDTIASYVCWVLDQPDDIEIMDLSVRTKPIIDNGKRYSDYRSD
jgi:NADP-dependent 3-hydroxy acid dehydrogenase YdfG